MSRERKRSDVAALAWSATLLLVGGCASVPPKDYRIGAGGVGVAVVEPTVRGAPTAAGNAAGGALLGALGATLQAAAFVGPAAVVFAPIGAVISAVQEASCGKKFTDAYPALADAFTDIARREVRSGDIAGSLAAELQAHTPAPVVAIDVPMPADDRSHVEALLAYAAEHELGHAIVVRPTVEVAAGTGCTNAQVGVRFDVTLWEVLTRQEVRLRPRLSEWRRREVSVEFGDLQVLLSEPGALQSRLQPQYGSWASDLYFQGGFELPGR